MVPCVVPYVVPFTGGTAGAEVERSVASAMEFFTFI